MQGGDWWIRTECFALEANIEICTQGCHFCTRLTRAQSLQCFTAAYGSKEIGLTVICPKPMSIEIPKLYAITNEPLQVDLTHYVSGGVGPFVFEMGWENEPLGM